MEAKKKQSFADKFPELVQEFDADRNPGIDIYKVSPYSHERVFWKKKYHDQETGKDFIFSWPQSFAERANGRGCPYLTKGNTYVYTGFNDLATKYPELAKQWHKTKNTIKPTKVATQSSKMRWWYYSYDVPDDYQIQSLRGKHFDFEWEERVDVRVLGFNPDEPCPFTRKNCPHIWVGFNDLGTTHPEVAACFDKEQNKGIDIKTLSHGMKKQIYWKINIINDKTGRTETIKWQESIKDMIYNKHYLYPPSPHMYRGELFVREYLEKHGLNSYVHGYKPDDLINPETGKALEFDFFIKSPAPVFIEYNGKQHEEIVPYFHKDKNAFEKAKKRDSIKREYAKQHKIPVIDIHHSYNTYEKVEKYLDKELLPYLQYKALKGQILVRAGQKSNKKSFQEQNKLPKYESNTRGDSPKTNNKNTKNSVQDHSGR